MIKVCRIKYSDESSVEQAKSIRTKVFVEEQKVAPELEYDEVESESHHYLVLVNEKPVGAARWRETSKGIKLERFAILSGYRNKGIGTVLLKEVMNDILPLNRPIMLHSQLKAISYYERQGFRKEGDIFSEAGIEHYLMVYKK